MERRCVPLWGLAVLLLTTGVDASADSQRLSARWKGFIGTRSGCFAVYNMRSRRVLLQRGNSCRKRVAPCCTFKVVNALIGLDSGVLKEPQEHFRWDGKKRYFKAWNKDQTLHSAMRRSTVWVFQQIARAIGPRRMQAYLFLDCRTLLSAEWRRIG